MAQVKKHEIQQLIEAAAIDTFLENGYINTKMKQIAAKADISVGNIYLYFKSKEHLFYTILPQSFAENFKDFNNNIFAALIEAFVNNAKNIKDYIPKNECIDYLIGNRKRLLMLLRYSKGTNYENLKEESNEIVIQKQNEYLLKLNKADNSIIEKNYKIIKMVLDSIINMLLDTLEGEMEIKERMNAIRFAYEYNLYGFKRLIEECVR